jgi:hypothetical protein
MPIKEETMNNLDKVEPETLLTLAMERLRTLMWTLVHTSSTLAQLGEELNEFVEHYDEWLQAQEDKDE